MDMYNPYFALFHKAEGAFSDSHFRA